ncbi:hypothetical protein JVU11DRAFT_1227 [Chiua virens]|nr:hypothetical protein JVU11DRAFT_1227 [Chiua virens]
MTGTFPFTATAFLSTEGLIGKVRHEVHHDLKLLFWVIWVTSVNLVRPFNKHRKWVELPLPLPSIPSRRTMEKRQSQRSDNTTPLFIADVNVKVQASLASMNTEPSPGMSAETETQSAHPSNFCVGLHLAYTNVLSWKSTIERKE